MIFYELELPAGENTQFGNNFNEQYFQGVEETDKQSFVDFFKIIQQKKI
jgi:hypothetical protein